MGKGKSQMVTSRSLVVGMPATHTTVVLCKIFLPHINNKLPAMLGWGGGEFVGK